MQGCRAAFLVVLLSVAVFIPGLQYGFVWDDVILIQDNQFLQPHNNPASFLGRDFTEITFGALTGSFYRPLFALTLWADGVVWGNEPFGFHVTNLLIHGLVVGLLFLVVRRLSNPFTATLASLLFAIHPAHSEVAVFISGRVDSLALALMLTCLWLFLQLDHTGSLWGRMVRHAGLVGISGLALAAKESAVVLPGLVLIVGLSDPAGAGHRRGARVRGTLTKMAGVLVVTGSYAVWRWTALTGYITQPLVNTGVVPRAVAGIGAFGYYTMQALAPVPLGPERYATVPDSPWNPLALVGWACLLGVACWLVWAWRGRPLAVVGLLWYLSALAPVLAALPITTAGELMLAERWLYTPSAGMLLAVAATGEPWLTRAGRSVMRRLAGGALLVWGAVGLAALFWITPIWQSNDTLHRYILVRNPTAPDPLINVARLEIQMGRPEVAVSLLQQAVTRSPSDVKAWLNLGLALRQLTRYDEALTAFRKSVQLNPGWIVPRCI